MDRVFSGPDIHHGDHQWVAQRAILAPHNKTVDSLNETLLSRLPGDEWVCRGWDELIQMQDGMQDIPLEYVNTLTCAGFPPFDLRLKRGAPIILLRNIDPAAKLCNGTRLIVDEVINGRLLKATLVSTGEQVCIPRIALHPKTGKFHFDLKRRQFPVRLAFAINKSQGQTLSHVGVLLDDTPCFGHGQLYVAASRASDPAGIHFLVPPGSVTRNVVYREALLP